MLWTLASKSSGNPWGIWVFGTGRVMPTSRMSWQGERPWSLLQLRKSAAIASRAGVINSPEGPALERVFAGPACYPAS
jgi:hypothetical protein